MKIHTALWLVIGAASPAFASAQAHSHHTSIDGNTTTLLEEARAATQRFADRREAIASGYRIVGRDFPSMGEHWLNTKLVVEGHFDVSKPQMLTYVKIDGKPVLTGVVYIVPLQQGESPPDAFGPGALWHEHNGTVDEEGLLPEHHSPPGAVTGTRVAFLHAWTTIPNSDGVFSAENWAIPFLRLGLAVPPKFPNGAARALSLLTGGREFFLELIGDEYHERANDALEQCAIVADRIAKSQTALTSADLQSLDSAWKEVLRKIPAGVGQRINGGLLP